MSGPALRPSVHEATRQAFVPTGADDFRPPMVLDSACGEDVCGRFKANAPIGCNILCTASQCMMRDPQLQYTCKPVTKEMIALDGSVGELHHGLSGPCKALNADAQLGPLDRAYASFQRVVQLAHSRISHGASEESQAASLTIAIDEFERAAARARTSNTHKDGNLAASAAEAERLIKELRTGLEHVAQARRPTDTPLIPEKEAAEMCVYLERLLRV